MQLTDDVLEKMRDHPRPPGKRSRTGSRSHDHGNSMHSSGGAGQEEAEAGLHSREGTPGEAGRQPSHGRRQTLSHLARGNRAGGGRAHSIVLDGTQHGFPRNRDIQAGAEASDATATAAGASLYAAVDVEHDEDSAAGMYAVGGRLSQLRHDSSANGQGGSASPRLPRTRSLAPKRRGVRRERSQSSVQGSTGTELFTTKQILDLANTRDFIRAEKKRAAAEKQRQAARSRQGSRSSTDHYTAMQDSGPTDKAHANAQESTADPAKGLHPRSPKASAGSSSDSDGGGLVQALDDTVDLLDGRAGLPDLEMGLQAGTQS